MRYFRVYNAKNKCIIEYEGINDKDVEILSLSFDGFIKRKLCINGAPVTHYTAVTDSLTGFDARSGLNAWLVSQLLETVESLLSEKSFLNAENFYEPFSQTRSEICILRLVLETAEVSSNAEMLRIISDKLEDCREKIAELVLGAKWKAYFYDIHESFLKTRLEIRILELALKTAKISDDQHIVYTISTKLKSVRKKLRQLFIQKYEISQTDFVRNNTMLEGEFSRWDEKDVEILVTALAAEEEQEDLVHLHDLKWITSEYEPMTRYFQDYFRVYNAKDECIIEYEAINDKDAKFLSLSFDGFIKRKLHINGAPVTRYIIVTDLSTNFHTHAMLTSDLHQKARFLSNARIGDEDYSVECFDAETQLEIRILELALKTADVSCHTEALHTISNKIDDYNKVFNGSIASYCDDYTYGARTAFSKTQLEIRMLELVLQTPTVTNKLKTHQKELRHLSVSMCERCQYDLYSASDAAERLFHEGNIEESQEAFKWEEKRYVSGCPHYGRFSK